MQKELLLSQKPEVITLSSQENPLTIDIETGPESVAQRILTTRAAKNASFVRRWDSEEAYEQELEKELELFSDKDEGQGQGQGEGWEEGRTSSSRSVSSCSVSDAIQTSRISLEGLGGYNISGSVAPHPKEDRLTRLLQRLHSHVTDSQGMGGKPFQILTDAGESLVLSSLSFALCLCWLLLSMHV